MSTDHKTVRWHTVRSAGVARTAALAGGLAASAALVYLLTAALGVAAAYDRPAALVRFGLIALPFVALLIASFLSGGGRGQWVSGLLSIGGAVTGALLSAYFLLSTDWQDAPSQYSALDDIAQQIAVLRPALDLPDTANANVAGGALVILILTGLGGFLWSLRRRVLWVRLPLALLALVSLLICGFTLVLTQSRGAWVACVAGLLALVFLLWLTGSDHAGAVRGLGLALAVLGALMLAGAILYVVVAPASAGQLIAQLGSTWSGRAQLWQDAQALMQDYRFTGSGLGSTMMVYSTYYLLLHVGHTGHMHNLYLEIAVQQGLPGLIAFLCLVTGTALMLVAAMTERSRGSRRLAAGALAALVAMLAHGLVDAGLYDSRLVPLLFLPLLVAWPIRLRPRVDDPVSWGRLAFAGAVLPLVLVVLPLLLPGSRAAFQANLGAVEQTIAELSEYSWPEVAVQDELRRADGVDLSQAEMRYRAGLALDPDNVTAHARLGQIALARGKMDAAREHLAAAYAAAPARRAVRLLLGEVVALQGDPAQAAALWQGLDFGSGQVELRRYWVEQMEDSEALARFEAAMQFLRAGQQTD